MRKRNEIDAAFRKLSKAEREKILTVWGFAAFGDIPDAMLPGVSSDIVEAMPSAFGSVTAKAATAAKPNPFNEMADAIYGGKGIPVGTPSKPTEQVGDLELNSHRPVEALFGDSAIDESKIYADYNKLSPRTIQARRQQVAE
jgi:hypothetical protein